MAIPIFSSAVNALGRTVYRQAGRFVSKETFERGAGFVARSKTSRTEPNIAQRLMQEIGPPIGGGSWVSRVRKSTERFTELLGDNNELG